MKPVTSFIFEIWDHIASHLSHDALSRLALVSDFHLQVARWHLYRNVILRNERQAIPSALDTIYLILRNPLLQKRIQSFTILTPSIGMSAPTDYKNWVERFGIQLFGSLVELRRLHLKRSPYCRVRLLERFMHVVSQSCRKLVHLTIDGPSSMQYRSVGSKYTFATPMYQLPSLRSLTVIGRNSNLGWNIASGVLLHPISNITTLQIEITLPEQRWLADPTDFSDIWSSRFPYLTTLTVGDMPQGVHTATLSIFLNRHPTITHLTLTARDADRTFSITLEPDALPNLQHLSVSPHMLHWLQVNVTLRSLRRIMSLVLDFSLICSSGPGAEMSTSAVLHHFPFYPQFWRLKRFTLLGISNVSVTKGLMGVMAGLAPGLEHWTGGFYHRHHLGDMLELASALSSHPNLRRLDICQWIGAECGVDQGSVGPFGAIFGALKALERITIFVRHVHMKTFEVVQGFEMRVRGGGGTGLGGGGERDSGGRDSGGGRDAVLGGSVMVDGEMVDAGDEMKRTSSLGRELVETYCLNSTKYGYQPRRLLDLASMEWESDELTVEGY